MDYKEKECEVCGAFFTPLRAIPNTALTAGNMPYRNSGRSSIRLSEISVPMDMDVDQNPLHANAATVKKISLPMVRKKISAVHPAHPNIGSHIPSVHTVESP